MRFTVQRPTAGRKVAGKCVKVKAANRSRPSCTRWVTVKGSYTTAGKKGVNTEDVPRPDGREDAQARRRTGCGCRRPTWRRTRSAYKTLRFTIVR